MDSQKIRLPLSHHFGVGPPAAGAKKIRIDRSILDPLQKKKKTSRIVSKNVYAGNGDASFEISFDEFHVGIGQAVLDFSPRDSSIHGGCENEEGWEKWHGSSQGACHSRAP